VLPATQRSSSQHYAPFSARSHRASHGVVPMARPMNHPDPVGRPESWVVDGGSGAWRTDSRCGLLGSRRRARWRRGRTLLSVLKARNLQLS
jgi:hypothetical protein